MPQKGSTSLVTSALVPLHQASETRLTCTTTAQEAANSSLGAAIAHSPLPTARTSPVHCQYEGSVQPVFSRVKLRRARARVASD
jgi:hypothetical protein